LGGFFPINVAAGIVFAIFVLRLFSLQKEKAMKLKVTLTALVLGFSPVVASAMGCMTPQQTASSCADGQVWDSDSGTCIEPITS